MNPRDSNKALLNTDYPLDLITTIKTGSLIIGGNSFNSLDIPHNLPYTPLAYGNWSTSPSFEIAYEYGTGPIHSNPAMAAFTTQPTIVSNSSDIRLTATNYTSSSPLTIYYRIYCLQPSNITGLESPHTNIDVDPFMINTDQEQVQLMTSGLFNFPEVSSSIYETVLFNHSLGYRPQALGWVERDGSIENKYQTSPSIGSPDIVVTDNDLILRVTPFSLAGTMHYRLYING